MVINFQPLSIRERFFFVRLRHATCRGILILLSLSAVYLTAPQTASASCVQRPQWPLRGETPVQGTCGALVIFARFQGEAASATAPAFAAEIFDPQRAGSLSHFYSEMSHGQFALTGEVLERWYAAENNAQFYMAQTGPQDSFGLFAADILRQVDNDIDFGLFDNDGTDGVPNSGDDDGFVDMIFMSMLTVPQGFVIGTATGVARLGLRENFTTADPSRRGGSIKIRNDTHRNGPAGVLLRGHTFEVAVGSMAHEFGHFLGLPDLFNTRFAQAEGAIEPEQDSAGIGYWGLMAHGTRGWDEAGGPNPFCAWSLEQLGWIGANNSDLEVVESNRLDVEFVDVNAGGKVRKIAISGSEEYFLIEHRGRETSYYERDLPASGLLVWHVDPSQPDDDDERAKLVDLVSADGLYVDAGFPLGSKPAPRAGFDNLDFWANDDEYQRTRGGNLGDAGDPFDGVTTTEFSVLSNPAAPSGLAIANIRRSSGGMVADIQLDDRRRAGIVLDDEEWQGSIQVVGDVVVGPRGRLEIAAGTHVAFSADKLARGLDPARTELVVEGVLVINRPGSGEVTLTSARDNPAPGDWYGICLRPAGSLFASSTTIEFPLVGLRSGTLEGVHQLEGLSIRWADQGIGLDDLQGQMDLSDLDVRDSRGAGVVVNGRGSLNLHSAALVNNGGAGLVRSGGELVFTRGELTGNGLVAASAANMDLRLGTFGRVTSSTFREGIGMRLSDTQEVLIRANSFSDQQVGITSSNSRPQILSNRFSRNELAMELSGDMVPVRLELNTVHDSDRLLENNAAVEVVATNNWWGTSDSRSIAGRILGAVVWQPFLNFDPRNPVVFGLSQSYPNPFNGSVVIEYTVGLDDSVVEEENEVLVEVRNTAGALVRRLVREAAFPGVYSITWDGRDEAGVQVGTGVYYYWLRIGSTVAFRKMMVLR